MTVKEIIEILQQFPEDAEVEISADGDAERVNFEVTAKSFYFVDFTKNPFVKDDESHPAHGKKIVTIEN